ncbi:MAG: UvrD-helicase domain-containing protein [Thiohalomonadales bacterium]
MTRLEKVQLSFAIDPQYNCVVSASAGTGKTWLLISRLLRLLLKGYAPGSIVAITFTRKAAAEMQARLADRLRELATCTPEVLDSLLIQLEINPDEQTRLNARLLYEQHLHHPYSVKTTTYHAFCQELLRRFPLEAEIPPGFELREQTLALQSEAWDDMFSLSTRTPDSTTAFALQHLFSYCGSLHNVKTALMEFLEHRLDWWLLSEGQTEPLSYAIHKLEQQVEVTDWRPETFFSENTQHDLLEFQKLLSLHPTKTNLQYVETLHSVFESCHAGDIVTAFENIISVFLKKDHTPLTGRKESKAQAKKMGDQGQQQFLSLHHLISQALVASIDTRLAITNMQANRAWYTAGNTLLNIYQSIKRSQRILDFNDLEWHCYQLLQKSDSAHWIQYKLDARIDHLLIDEFQDTNPTQWRLILPLLEEMAAAEGERARSVFLVGDEKQSIYRFRRAEPKLFKLAQQWLTTNLASKQLQISKSWRSAEVIMSFVNNLFADGPLHRQLPHFPTHSTQFTALYGRVEIFPLISAESEQDGLDKEVIYFRNPLEQAYAGKRDSRYAREATLIATTINTLISENSLMAQGDETRRIDYQDIIILLRSRTHIAEYEHALRTHAIPYSGGDKKGLLDCLEIQDMMALLEILITPHNNLAIAHVLRSPLFSASDIDLQYMAAAKQSWYEYLLDDTRIYSSPSLDRATEFLPRWHTYASYLPVHDVLDKIYHEADILKAYRHAAPDYLSNRINTNLQYFIDLALDLDSGRYPSMQFFLAQLQQAKTLTNDAPDQPSIQDQGSFVRILSIHGAKGLEAPVVFLADTARTAQTAKPYQATVDWPIDSPLPQQYFMRTDKKRQDKQTQAILDRLGVDDQQEDAHLLYVAITRPKQFLYISGVAPLKGDDLGWYGIIRSQCENHSDTTNTTSGGLLMQSGVRPPKSTSIKEIAVKKSEIKLIDLPNITDDASKKHFSVSPSRMVNGQPRSFQNNQNLAASNDDNKRGDAALRGQFIHRAIELLSNGYKQDYTQRQLVTESLITTLTENEIMDFVHEAQAVIEEPECRDIMQGDGLIEAYNEIPISYINENHSHISGIIDRLAVYKHEIYIIDYKTQQCKSTTELQLIAESYRPQMSLYAQGVKKIWPQARVHCIIIFTHRPYVIRL